MELSPFVEMFFNLMKKIIDTLASFNFTVYGLTVNPFVLSIAMIVIYMCIYSFWKGSRA